MEINYLKIIQCDFLDIFFDSVSHSWCVPTMKITDLSILCKWETLDNWQCVKYLFAPLYFTNHFTHTQLVIMLYLRIVNWAM